MTDRELMQQALEAAQLSDYSKADGDFYKWWYSHMQNDLMQPPLNEVGYRVARYIWDAALRDRLAQPQMQPCAGRNCGSTNPNLHSAECFEDYEKSTGMAQPEQEPVAWEDVLGAIARGWTHDDNRHKTMDVQLAVAIAKEIQDMVIAPPQRKPPQFPTMLRKMWSGAEVQKWINENWEQT